MWFMYRTKNSLVFWNDRIPRGLITYFLGFYLGMFLSKFDLLSKKQRIIVRIISLVVIGLFVALLCVKKFISFNGVLDVSLAIGVGIFPFLIVLLYDIEKLNVLCSTKFVNYLGKLAFPMFILNFPVLYTVQYIDGGNFIWLKSIGWPAFLILIALHLGVSIIWERASFYTSTLIKTVKQKPEIAK